MLVFIKTYNSGHSNTLSHLTADLSIQMSFLYRHHNIHAFIDTTPIYRRKTVQLNNVSHRPTKINLLSVPQFCPFHQQWHRLPRIFGVKKMPKLINISINKNELYEYSVWHNYIIFIVILLLATSFGLNGPSSGQYYQKKNWKCWCIKYININFMGSHLHSLIVFINTNF